MDIYTESEYYITNWIDEIQDDTLKFLNFDKNTLMKHGVSFDIVKFKILNLIKKCKDNVLFVAHNAAFDYNVLKTCGLDLSKYKWICTMENGRKYFNKYPKLLDLAHFFNINVDEKRLHRALYDTQICANILFCMKTNCKNTQIENIRIMYLRNRMIEIFYHE
jgi:DNA polymerase III epsilon subunit-like protein